MFPPNGPYPTILLSSWHEWAQAYCINPPNNLCVYEYICPNPDITGSGQQMSSASFSNSCLYAAVLTLPPFSVYITEIIFCTCLLVSSPNRVMDTNTLRVTPSAIFLVYWPKKIHVAMYSHFALIFSLLISATTSIANQQLTKGDTIFVVVMVASPTSIYLWVTSLASFRKPMLFLASNISFKRKEVLLLTSLCLFTLLYEIGMAVVAGVYGKFSQAACFRGYSRSAYLKLLWPLIPAFQFLGYPLVIISVSLPYREEGISWWR